MILAMLNWPQEKLAVLGSGIATLREHVTLCPECGNLSENKLPCRVCSSLSRDRSIICVVEDPAQLLSIEKSSFYRGLYHVLGGKLAPLEGKSPEQLNIPSLLQRLQSGNIREIVIALSSDVEGRATAIYLAGLLKDSGVKITRIASGLPAGTSISYANSDTIAAALSGRTEF